MPITKVSADFAWGVLLAVLVAVVGCGNPSEQEPKQASVEQASVEPSAKANPPANPAKIVPSKSSSSDDSSLTVSVVAKTRQATWVGSDACQECHSERHDSFQESHHSRSLTKIDPESELTGVEFVHEASRRRYEVEVRGDEVWHVEKLLDAAGSGDESEPLTLSEFPIRYVMGSGKFAKGYMVADGDYLLQSPLTWYTNAKEYAMSPGYDTPAQGSFSRAVTDQCLFCHAGNVTRKANQNPHHFTIHETSIGCERCHGAGSEHVRHYQSRQEHGAGDLGLTESDANKSSLPPEVSLVSPNKLSREDAQSLCAQCHRQGVAPVSAPGKQDWDFRPGQDFAQVKFNYDLVKTDPPENGFVGHFAQLGESKCYQMSEMTCITCHSPHQHTSGEAKHELHRQQCNACHAGEDDSCQVELSMRVSQADNRCVTCHMPRRDSKVPHSSTTDHRIAVHRKATKEPTLLKTPVVYPLQEIPESMSPEVAARMRALGLFGLYRMNVGNPNMESLRREASQSLTAIANQGRGDEQVFAALATLVQMQLERAPRGTPETRQQWEYAFRCAQEAIRLNGEANNALQPTESLGDAMEVTGRFFVAAGQNRPAAEVFSELAAIRRRKFDWATLGLSLGKIGDNVAAEKALRQAIHIFAGDPDLYEILAIVLQKKDPEEAKRLGAIAKRLRDAMKQK